MPIIVALIPAGILAFIFWLLSLLLLPALNFGDPVLWGFVGTYFLVLAGLYFFSELDDEIDFPLSACSAAVGGFVLAVLMIISIISSSLFQSGAYRNAHVVNVSTREDAKLALPQIEESRDIPVIDRYTASMLGDRAMGEMEKYLSQYEVSSEYSLIEYQGKFYRISPLEYGGFWKYNNSKSTGIPGYVLVDIYTGEAELIEFAEGKNIKYAPSAYWGKDLIRHVRGKYPCDVFGDYHFEIDDEGTPYYIVAVKKPNAGLFSACTVDSVIVVNAVSGECEKYKLDEVPEWVDMTQSVEQLMTEINWHFEYVHGPLNLSSKDVRKTSYSYDVNQFYMFPNNGDVYLYTGVTSAGNDESNIGFILANMKTGEVNYYTSPGAEESSAQSSAAGLVANYGYKAGPVMLVTIDGVESYFMTLKDNNGLVKRYALVNKEDYNIATVEDTVADTVYSYRTMFSSIETIGNSGIVESVYTAIIDGNTTYIFKLVGIDNFYLSDIEVSFEQHEKLIVGAEVDVTYNELGNKRMVNSISFK